ncbi:MULTISPECIES: acyltransferase [unclassified Thalassospira]|uniref:acyltransferase n=1 Tax=unclassified Thalassospira TaxID=2648997 RepID=UPI001B13C18B|nr:acyltransferase [Thalassospira sp.]MBO6769759.1 acyltransferase [Thalassospira sp.]
MEKRFSDDLMRAYLVRDNELLEEFKRSLPLQDALDDRWERARRLGFDEGVSIYNSAVVFSDVAVGSGTWIGPYVILDGSGGGIEIGSTCSISSGVYIYTHDTLGWALSGGKSQPRRGAVKIGNCCYIASQSIISAGVTIGDRCVISANSFVNRDVPDNTIVGGSPAKKIGHVEMADGEPVLIFENGKRVAVANQGGSRL